MRRLAALPAACVVLVALAQPATAVPEDGQQYTPPVDAPVVDVFRPPTTPYGPGNRGIDFATRAGGPVGASADGEVVFAGPVGGALHVVVLHPDGLRTSYSFLGSVAVRSGDRVERGQPVGRAGPTLHFGVRAGRAYLDPAALFGERLRVRLVPAEQRRAVAAARRAQAASLLELAADGRGGGALDGIRAAVGWARRQGGRAVALVRGEAASLYDELLTWAHYVRELSPTVHWVRIGSGIWRWWDRRNECTPAAVEPPRRRRRRIAVMVAGLGSSSSHASITGLDTTVLGYAEPDVVRFSYAGGRTPDPTDGPASVPASAYGPIATEGDLRDAAGRLLALLEHLRIAAPGVPVDVFAHSQGGVVARLAMDQLDPRDPRFPDVGTLVTLGSPHGGADLATATTQLGRTTVGQGVLLAADGVVGISAGAVSVRQLSETSALMRELAGRPVPDHVRVVSIAARGDLVVPAGRSRLDGAVNVVVPGEGLQAHAALPGSSAAHREVALALAGLPPTCESLADGLADAVLPEVIGWAEDALGAGMAAVGRRVEARVPGAHGPPVRTPGPVEAPVP